VGLKLNGTNQLLVYAYDENLLGDNIDTIKENMGIFKFGLEVIAEKTEVYVAVSSPECRAKL
jgi:hypothetical protein